MRPRFFVVACVVFVAAATPLTGARHSAFHLSKRRFSSGYFGNYPQAILVGNRFVACDRPERRFLIKYADGANFALDCLSSRS